jgi:hypothetical protein
MLRLLVVAFPILIAVGATFVTLRISLPWSAEERFKKLITASFMIGLLCSLITYSQLRPASPPPTLQEEQKDKAASEAAQHYEAQIAALNLQVASLQRQVGNNAKLQMSQSNAQVSKSATGLPDIYWTQNNLANSGEVQVNFTIYGELKLPAFVAICDQPCRIAGARAGSGSVGEELVGSGGPGVAGYIFKKPRPMTAGTEGYIILRGAKGGGLKVTEFRILSDSEVPDALK